MYSFRNDYSEGAHPRILENLIKNNLVQQPGYGEDIHCKTASSSIKTLLQREDAWVHFVSGGTQTNLLVISSFLRPYQAVISADTGHINVHETGAIEATGHKVLTAATSDGKLTPASIQRVLEVHQDEHMVQPKMVYISTSTELGTIYSKAELSAIRHLCNACGLLLFLDGARLGSALMSAGNDITLADLADLTDAFYIGGTKNGALLGEALVICRKELYQDFRFCMKQRGAMLAKSFLIGIQFEALFQDGLYFELATHANQMADRIKTTLKACGYTFLCDSPTNQLFPILPNTLLDKLSKNFDYTVQATLEQNQTAIRLVTSWATTETSVNELCSFFQSHPYSISIT